MSKTVLYTRNHYFYQKNSDFIRKLPITFYHLPLIDAKQNKISNQDKKNIFDSEYLIFCSQNSVKFLLNQINLPRNKKLIAIGKQTANLLSKTHKIYLTAPKPFNSESLLQVFSPKNKTISLITTTSHRGFLLNFLKQNNQTNTIFPYQVFCPSKIFPIDLNFDFILISSQAAIDNLLKISTKTQLKLIQSASFLVLISQRLADYAQGLGFTKTLVSPIADEKTQINTILNYLSKQIL